jgi:hypothetical protein
VRAFDAPAATSELVVICHSDVSPDQTGAALKFPSLKLSKTVNAHGGGGANGGEAVRPFFAHNVKGKQRATQRVKTSLFMTILLKFRNQ